LIIFPIEKTKNIIKIHIIQEGKAKNQKRLTFGFQDSQEKLSTEILTSLTGRNYVNAVPLIAPVVTSHSVAWL
jgi:hypothetical protein